MCVVEINRWRMLAKEEAVEKSPHVFSINHGDRGSLADVTAWCTQRGHHILPFAYPCVPRMRWTTRVGDPSENPSAHFERALATRPRTRWRGARKSGRHGGGRAARTLRGRRSARMEATARRWQDRAG